MKKPATSCILALALLLLWGCGSLKQQNKPLPYDRSDVPATCPKQEVAEVIPPEPPKPPEESPRRKGKKSGLYRSGKKIYYPTVKKRGYEERGVASWYGPSFHGRKTASGQLFDMHRVSAAHRLLPMHAQVIVTNLENGRSTTLTVNDRGPFVAGRVIDLSYAAAKKLGMLDQGLARVDIRASNPLPGQKDGDLLGDFFVHIGSFQTTEAANYLVDDMKCLRYKHSMIKVIKTDRDGEIRWRVELGPYTSMSDAHRAHSITVKDYPSAFVVSAS